MCQRKHFACSSFYRYTKSDGVARAFARVWHTLTTTEIEPTKKKRGEKKHNIKKRTNNKKSKIDEKSDKFIHRFVRESREEKKFKLILFYAYSRRVWVSAPWNENV